MRKIVNIVLVGAIGAIIGATINDLRTKKSAGNKLRKFRLYYNLLNQWLFLKNKGTNLETCFIERKIYSIAIYGMGEVGERLCEELKESKVQVKYAIDTKRYDSTLELPRYNLIQGLEPVDAIVVTPIFDYQNIEKEIKKVGNHQVISLYDIVFDVNGFVL